MFTMELEFGYIDSLVRNFLLEAFFGLPMKFFHICH